LVAGLPLPAVDRRAAVPERLDLRVVRGLVPDQRRHERRRGKGEQQYRGESKAATASGVAVPHGATITAEAPSDVGSSVTMLLRHLQGFIAALVSMAAGSAIALAAPAGGETDTEFPETADFTAVDFDWLASANMTDSFVTLAPGGTVTFSYPSGQ